MKSVFDRDSYRYQMRENIFGIPKLFFKDLKYCYQRIHRGYCDKDLWDISDWFLQLIPDMLQSYKENRYGSPGCLGENYTDENGVLRNDTCHGEWDKILEQMIYLFREADEDTCSRKNPLEEDYDKINREFEEAYGLLGEKLQTEAERNSAKHRMYFPSDLPEYAGIMEKYWEEDQKLEVYRNACKDQAFALLAKWFWNLWD